MVHDKETPEAVLPSYHHSVLSFKHAPLRHSAQEYVTASCLSQLVNRLH